MPALDGNRPQVSVRAPGFALGGLRADDHFRAVGRERDVVSPHAPRRPVGIARSQVACRAALRGLREHVRALAVLPLRPVPREKMIDEPRFDLARLALLEALLVARVDRGGVAGAAGVDLARVRDPSPVGRPHACVRAEEQRRDLLRIPAVRQVVEPELLLLLSVPLRDHEKLLAVGRPSRVLAVPVAGELSRGSAGERL